MLLAQIPVGTMANFSYLIADHEGGEAVAVDPGFEAEPLLEAARSLNVKINRIALTHHHHDHVEGCKALQGWTRAMIYAHPVTIDLLRGQTVIDESVGEGEVIPCGSEEIRVLHTPGHAPGSICLLVEDHWLLTGDTLFIGNCGRADLEGGDPEILFASLQRLKQLSGDLLVCPGHDYGPATMRTLKLEMQDNPALVAPDMAAFLRIP